MIEGHEVTPNLWVLRNSDTSRNIRIILGDTGAMLIDPGTDQTEINAIRKFLTDMNTNAPSPCPTPDPGPISSFPDWEAITLSHDIYCAVYNKKERILLCGDMLRANDIPHLTHGSQPYLDALEKLEALDARLLLPLYGPEARGKREIKARIEQDRNYIYALQRHVVTSRAARAPLDRVLLIASQVYEDSPHLEAHLQNIRLIWEE